MASSKHVSIPLSKSRPDLAAEWHPTKNEDLKPSDVSTFSKKKVWWIGPCGHEWAATISNRSKGSNCPYCSAKRTIVGVTDLQTTHPQLAKEWHPTKNAPLFPTDVSQGSAKRVWWLGQCGHEWQARVQTRTVHKTGCPICNKETQTSFPEQALFYYIRKSNDDAINLDTATLGTELDIYIPSKKTAFEYDGVWHKNRIKNDLKKNRLCKAHGITLIRIREKGLEEFEDCICITRSELTEKGLDSCIIEALKCIPDSRTPIDVDVARDRTDIMSLFIQKRKENSLQALFPEIAKEWHPTKNGYLKPESFFAGSNKKVWWLGTCGHEWQAIILSRTKDGNGCPICSGRKALAGFNDLQTTNPALAREWHPYKNNGLSPTMVTGHSGKKVWWQDQYGHEWAATIANRADGHGCPFCSGRLVVSGENDLQTLFPCLAAEWHPQKNSPLTPSEISAGSGKKVWWLGKCGHEWQAAVKDRSNGSGCPICINQKIIPGYNDLKTIDPDLANEWHPYKNNGLSPDSVAPNSSKRVWWLGECGHEWQTAISKRYVQRSGCPFCSNHLVLTGFNDLQTLNPKLAEEWHPSKNGLLTPDRVLAGSHKKVWWLGKCGHEWQAVIKDRNAGSGCKLCSNREKSIKKRKQVLCIETNIIYASLTEAESTTGLSSIQDCCRGRIKTAGGYHWKYID